jgi:hypothetical protein
MNPIFRKVYALPRFTVVLPNTEKRDSRSLFLVFYPKIGVHPRLHLHRTQVRVSVVKKEFSNRL